ncbi:biopolymer transporter ExbD [Nonlabens sp. Ci31]|jgi:biopolymer transport protein ExbD|uniref:ExbD/TolR family protein n=1 Tax=Nonlabens sp. Ci31 TaxID=2608253 RepID=UPI00146367AE|nr:biopolymer transporter ExbD [Nonlabens sp. Ci31]QJP34152.1 biopolymer transporter ExbD [Nonlabens sp. Ci31]
MARRSAPEVNAGSMADIAFLLLIFFLVTTTIEVDSGIASKLPPPIEIESPPPPIKEKNIFQVVVNAENRLLVEDADMEIGKLTDAAVKFLDNGGGTDARNVCTYCRGDKNPKSSDNPKKAVISLVNDRQTSYKMYLAVTNELVRAYAILRDREAKRLYNETYQSMSKRSDDWPADEKETPEYLELQDRMENVRDLFPRNLSEAEPQNRE